MRCAVIANSNRRLDRTYHSAIGGTTLDLLAQVPPCGRGHGLIWLRAQRWLRVPQSSRQACAAARCASRSCLATVDPGCRASLNKSRTGNRVRLELRRTRRPTQRRWRASRATARRWTSAAPSGTRPADQPRSRAQPWPPPISRATPCPQQRTPCQIRPRPAPPLPRATGSCRAPAACTGGAARGGRVGV